MSINTTTIEERLKKAKYNVYKTLNILKQELEDYDKIPRYDQDIIGRSAILNDIKDFETRYKKLNIMKDKLKYNLFTEIDELELEEIEWFFDEEWD